MRNIRYLLFALAIVSLTSCNEENETPQLQVPDTYSFERNGQSSVDYSGQLARRDMLNAMKSEVSKGDQGQEVDAQVLLNMFANENNPFASADLNTSGKELEDKTFLADVQWFKDLFVEAENTSKAYVANPTEAADGVAGRIERGTSGKFILVNDKGWEYTQFVEKGLMGAVFLHQIYNTYLTDNRIGNQVENETLEEGENFTPMEHHWDEAFGYYGAPIDFTRDDEDKYWAKYAGPALGTSADQLDIYGALKDAFITGRAAIAAGNMEIKNQQRDALYKQLELAAAASSLHYINNAKADLSANDMGSLFHHLSEAYNFTMALKYHPAKKLSQSDIDAILNTDYGTDGDFWTVSVSSLNDAMAKIVAAYPELENVKDIL